MRRRAFTLVEMTATMLVLGLAASFVGPLMVELSRGSAFQNEARRELWETNHALERIAELVRTAPEGVDQSSGLTEISATHFERHDGRGVRFENGSVYLFDDDGESLLAENFAQDFELRVLGRDGVTEVAETPEDAWRAELGVDIGMGMVRTAVSLARPAPEEAESLLVAAYAFGQNAWTRPVPGDPSQDYTKVVQYGANFTYDSGRGYGYTDTSGLDDSPNNRGKYNGDDEIYDQFIGCKYAVGNTIVFRADVPNGEYRFVLAGGDPSYAHTTRITVRDGSLEASEQVLVGNIAHQVGEFFRVGFPGHSAPGWDGEGRSPTFFPQIDSPTLTVTQGYIELHQIDAGTNGGCVCVFEIWQGGDEESPFIDFTGYSLVSFGGSQDGASQRETTAEVLDGGSTLRLYGNPWKAIEFPYTVTANTVIEFEYASSIEGEIQGIQTATDLQISSQRALSVWGTQAWARIRPNAIDEYDGSGDFQQYSIKLRDVNASYPLGEIVYLVFLNDDDAGAYSESIFRNVRVYEDE